MGWGGGLRDCCFVFEECLKKLEGVVFGVLFFKSFWGLKEWFFFVRVVVLLFLRMVFLATRLFFCFVLGVLGGGGF